MTEARIVEQLRSILMHDDDARGELEVAVVRVFERDWRAPWYNVRLYIPIPKAKQRWDWYESSVWLARCRTLVDAAAVAAQVRECLRRLQHPEEFYGESKAKAGAAAGRALSRSRKR